MGTVYNIAEMLCLQLHVSSDTFCCSFQVKVLEMRTFHLKTRKRKKIRCGTYVMSEALKLRISVFGKCRNANAV
jgi:hypothetical protein